MHTTDTKGAAGSSAAAGGAPSAPPLPPSYDDVISGLQDEAGEGSTSASNRRENVEQAGPFGNRVPKPSAPQQSGESQPLISSYLPPDPYAARDADALSSRDFFGSLEYKRTSKGYSSSDRWLNSDARALLRFLNECNERPRVTIEVVGSHDENRVTDSVRTENGQVRRDTQTRRETVVDFKFTMELTPFIHEKGSLYAARSPVTNQPMDIRDIVQSYVDSDNALKEIRVAKKAIWDYDAVRREIARVVQEAGYPHNVLVTFPMAQDCIKVKSNAMVSRVWRHPITSFLCCISCACLVGWPIERAATSKWRNMIASDFVVMLSPQDY
ncbi:hypothetical protein LPJ70_005246, partial [Coemansia sp. RSA 2708]